MLAHLAATIADNAAAGNTVAQDTIAECQVPGHATADDSIAKDLRCGLCCVAVLVPHTEFRGWLGLAHRARTDRQTPDRATTDAPDASTSRCGPGTVRYWRIGQHEAMQADRILWVQTSHNTQCSFTSLQAGCTKLYLGGVHFVCDHAKYRSAKRHNFGCNLFGPPLPVPKVAPNIEALSKTNITR